MEESKFKVLLVGFCLSIALHGGCGSATQVESDDDEHTHEHAHDDAPKSLRAAVVELRGLWTDISTAMDKNDLDAAHDPLHEVGHLLAAMPDLAAETDLPEEKWNEIKAEADKLFGSFGELDSAFHKKDGDKQAAYNDSKSSIDEGVAALESSLPLLDDHEHEGEHAHESEHDHSSDEDHGHANEHADVRPAAE